MSYTCCHSALDMFGLQEWPFRLDNTHALSYAQYMRKTIKYRLYPNKQQQRLLDQQLEECR